VYNISVNFLPYVGGGQIKFDSLRDDVRKTLGTFKEFKKTKYSSNTTDDFLYCHVFFDEYNKVEAIEYFNSIEFLFKEKDLFLFQFNDLKLFLESNAIIYQEDDSGLRSDSVGLSVYSPDKNQIETILIYRRGYFD
jgi:hypothetical protein